MCLRQDNMMKLNATPLAIRIEFNQNRLIATSNKGPSVFSKRLERHGIYSIQMPHPARRVVIFSG